MKFNIKLFNSFATIAYSKIDDPSYTLDETLGVFDYYFSRYELTLKIPHPNIRVRQIEHIIRVMSFVYDVHGEYPDIDAEYYPAMIDKHFATEYRDSDYNINHFFSGNIRALRLYESSY